MPRFETLIIISVFIAGAAFSQDGPDDTLWVDLFNGEDFTGLYTYDYANGGHVFDSSLAGVPLFRPKEGQIQVYSESGGHRGHIGSMREDYSYFHMKVDIQINRGNCGIMYHLREDLCEPRDDSRLYKVFPPSIEAQGEKGNKGDCWVICNVWMKTSVEPGSNRYDPDGEEREFGDVGVSNRNMTGYHEFEIETNNAWNTVEVIAFADSHVVHLVNGNIVFQGWDITYTPGDVSGPNRPSPPYEKVPFGHGHLTLQAEFSRANYKNWKVAELLGCMDPAAANFKSYLVKHADSLCVYETGCKDTAACNYNALATTACDTCCRYTDLTTGECTCPTPDGCPVGIQITGYRLFDFVVSPDAIEITADTDYHIEFLDVKGRVVFTNSGTGETMVDVKNILEPGIYFLHITTDKNALSRKLFVF